MFVTGVILIIVAVVLFKLLESGKAQKLTMNWAKDWKQGCLLDVASIIISIVIGIVGVIFVLIGILNFVF